MTAKQLQRLLDSAGLSQRGAARAIGISDRQMRRYISGEAPVPTTVEYALRWLIYTRATPEKHRGVPPRRNRDS